MLWAYNDRHLDFLQRFVSATLRERRPVHSSLVSRLPDWVKAAKNRAAVKTALGRLERMEQGM